ncbi:MAG: helix-turn-helix domain-containing protein [Aeromonas sp.]
MTPEQIKQARLTLGLSQTEMCRALGLTSVMTYAKWESGATKPTASGASSIKMISYMAQRGGLDGWLTYRHEQPLATPPAR